MLCKNCGSDNTERGFGWCTQCINAARGLKLAEGPQFKSPRSPNYKIYLCSKCGALLTSGKFGRRVCDVCNSKLEKEKLKFLGHYFTDGDAITSRANAKKWKRANPEKVREYGLMNTHVRRARIKGNGGSFTLKEINKLYIEQDNNCYYCGKPFFNNTLVKDCHIDHKTPISRGGSNGIENIVLSCSSCNQHKSNKTEEEFKKEGE